VKLVETWSMNRFYTIGYWGWRDVREFIEFLKDLGIRILVDVRRFPRSKNSGFNRENLEAELNKHTMRYVFMGETLGGYQRGGYEKYTQSEAYKEGIRKLHELAEEGNLAIMCLERSHRYCHRRFISETLEKMGVKAVHLDARAKD